MKSKSGLFALASTLLLSACASDPNWRVTEKAGFVRFEVKEISKREFLLTLFGPGVAARNLDEVDALFDERAKQLCAGKRYLANVSNEYVPYRSAGAFGASFQHTGIKRAGKILCQDD